jgi:HEAT repeat protein
MPNKKTDVERLYFEGLLSTTRDIDTRIVLQMQRIITPRVSDVFVPLTVTGIEPRLGSEGDREDRKNGAETEERDRNLHLRMTTPVPPRISTGRPIPVTEIVTGRQFNNVILGDPGSGKSTLLRWMVQMMAGRRFPPAQDTLFPPPTKESPLDSLPASIVPVQITLRFFAQALDDAGGLSLLQYLSEHAWRESFADKAATVGKYVLEAAKGGNALFLLDGLDEAINADVRKRVVEAISGLNRELSGNRLLVTSRMIGYELAPLPDAFAAWTLNPFTPKQTGEFFRKWALLIEREEDVPDQGVDEFMRRRAEVRGTEILQGMGYRVGPTGELEAELDQESDEALQHVRQLAANPMLCTLIGLIHHQGKRLPDDRAELYRLCLEAFVFDWEIQKRIRQIERMALDKFETFDVLEELAFRMHKETSSNYLSEAAIRGTIEDFLVNEKGLQVEQSRQRAANQMQIIRDRAGLLIARGEGLYGFGHLQFQEYLAGRALVRRRQDINLLLRQFLWQPRWQEPIILTAAYRAQHSEEAATEYIEAIRNTLPPERFDLSLHLEDLLHHALFMAARCLSDAKRVHFQMRQRIISELNNLLRDRSRTYLWERALKAIGGAKEFLDLTPLIEAITSAKDATVRASAANAVAILRSESALESLKQALDKDPDPQVRAQAVIALGTLSDPQIAELLISAMKFDDSANVRRNCVTALVTLGAAGVLGHLLEVLKSDPDWSVRRTVASQLRYFEVPAAIGPLTAAMNDDDPWVCGQAAATLKALGSKVDAQSLIETLRTNPDQKTRCCAAAALGGIRSTIAIGALADALISDSDAKVRQAAADAFRFIGPDLAVLPLIKALESDSDWNVRWRAADCLGASGSEDVIPHLINALKSDEDWFVRGSAAEALEGFGTVAAVQALIAALSEKEDWAREKVVSALGVSGAHNAVKPLLKIMKVDRDVSVRIAAANAIGGIGLESSVTVLAELLADKQHKKIWPALDAALRQIIFR